MKLKRVAVLCSSSRQFKDWVKENELQRGIKKHFAIDTANFIEYTGFFIHEPLHRAEDKFDDVHYWSIMDISIPELNELNDYNERLALLQGRVKRNEV